MRDIAGNSYYFRLRNGAFRFENEDTSESLASGTAPDNLDGCCDLGDALSMVRATGLNIVMGGGDLRT